MPSPAPNGSSNGPAADVIAGIRTLALVGPAAAGKTSLAEALLHRAGMIAAPGSLERGSTVSDFDPLERRMQHSLNAAVMHLQHAGTRVHFIDTPGAQRPGGPVAAVAGGGGDRGHRRQCRQRHRADGRAHDGVRGAAPPGSRDPRQQDRCARRGPGGAAGADPGHLRQGVPAGEPAPDRQRRHEGGGLLLQPRRPQRLRRRRCRAPRAGRAGGRGRCRFRRPLPERRRHRRRANCTRRWSRHCAKAT